MADDPRRPRIPTSDPLPDGLTADATESDATVPATPPEAATSPPASEQARTPDEYLETPGSHRRPDGAATDVGA